MNERDWLILQVLYEKKNITKTGQALFISQPALTTRLRQIVNAFIEFSDTIDYAKI